MKNLLKNKNLNNLEKFNKITLYHWSPFKFDNFKNQITFFTTSKEFAFDYANEKSFDWQMDEYPKIYERVLKDINKVFDSLNDEHFELLRSKLTKNEYIIWWTWWCYKVSKEQFLDELRWISWIQTPKFVFNDNLKVWDIFEENYDIWHTWHWKVLDFDNKYIKLQKLLKNEEKKESFYSWRLLDTFWPFNEYSKNVDKYMKEKWYDEVRNNRDWDLVFYKISYDVLKEQTFKKEEYYKEKWDLFWWTFEWDKDLVQEIINLWFIWIKMKEKKADTYMIFEPNKVLEK